MPATLQGLKSEVPEGAASDYTGLSALDNYLTAPGLSFFLGNRYRNGVYFIEQA